MSNQRNIVQDMVSGEVLKNLVERQVGFVFFLFALVIVYMSLHYAFGQTLDKRTALERELKRLRIEYTSSTTALRKLSKREEVSKHLADFGSKLHAPVLPPKRIIMDQYPHE